MPHYNTQEICHKKTTRKKTNNNINKNKKFKAKTLNLKAPSNNVKMQSDKTLTIQTNFFLFTQQRLSDKCTKRKYNEANFKNQSTFFKPNNFKSLKNHKLVTKYFSNLVKSHYETNGTCLGLEKPWERTKDTKKFKNYKQYAKTQIIGAIKINSYYLNFMYFYFSFHLY